MRRRLRQTAALLLGVTAALATVAATCSVNVTYTNPPTQCNTVATNQTWVNYASTSLSVSISQPQWCPTVIYTGVGTSLFSSYAATYSMDPGIVSGTTPYLDLTFVDAAGQHPNAYQFLITNGLAQANVGYTAGQAGNATNKTDSAKNVIHTVGGNATGTGLLTYAYYQAPGITAPQSIKVNQPLSVSANASFVQQPATYQWFADNVAQGWVTSNTYSSVYGTSYSNTGTHTFKAQVKDKYGTITTTPTKSVDVLPCNGCPQ